MIEADTLLRSNTKIVGERIAVHRETSVDTYEIKGTINITFTSDFFKLSIGDLKRDRFVFEVDRRFKVRAIYVYDGIGEEQVSRAKSVHHIETLFPSEGLRYLFLSNGGCAVQE